jgi:hypothetical protein
VNTGQRIAILVVAVVVLAGGFVLAQGSDDEGGAEQTRTPAETAASDPTETAEGTGGAEGPSTTPPTQESEPAAPAPRVETVRIRDNQPAAAVRTLRFQDGETIRLRFRSNVASEVHIHGYDKYVDVPAGGSARTSFKASAQGVFEMEDHGTGAVLAKLEVRP